MTESLELALYHLTIPILASKLTSIAHQKVSKVYYSSLQKKGVPLNLPMILKNSLTLSHLGGGGFCPPWKTFLNNSETAQDIKMKFFKFNLTLMGVILHMMTILINLRCCHGNLLLWMCCGIETWRNLHIWQNIGLILLKFGVGGYFLILNPKSIKKFL